MEHKDKIPEEVKADVQKAIDELKAVMESEDAEDIKEKVQALQVCTGVPLLKTKNYKPFDDVGVLSLCMLPRGTLFFPRCHHVVVVFAAPSCGHDTAFNSRPNSRLRLIHIYVEAKHRKRFAGGVRPPKYKWILRSVSQHHILVFGTNAPMYA